MNPFRMELMLVLAVLAWHLQIVPLYVPLFLSLTISPRSMIKIQLRLAAVEYAKTPSD